MSIAPIAIVCPIKQNIKVYHTWDEANTSDSKGPLCVVFPFNEYAEPKYVRALPGQVFTCNRAFEFTDDYYLCVSTNLKDSSFSNIQDTLTEAQLARRNDLMNPLISKYFHGFNRLEKIPSSAILVKAHGNEESNDSVVKRHLIDVDQTILSDIPLMIRRYNDTMRAIFENPFNGFI